MVSGFLCGYEDEMDWRFIFFSLGLMLSSCSDLQQNVRPIDINAFT